MGHYWFGILFGGAFIFTTLAAWVTHIVVCIQGAAWWLLTIGAFMAPVGVIHGIMIWFGAGMV
jgi:hypothetical protein